MQKMDNTCIVLTGIEIYSIPIYLVLTYLVEIYPLPKIDLSGANFN